MRYAQFAYPHVGRCAIFDFDVHHGNGTQEMRAAPHSNHRLLIWILLSPPFLTRRTGDPFGSFEDDPTVLFVSTHVYYQARAFYPVTGGAPSAPSNDRQQARSSSGSALGSAVSSIDVTSNSEYGMPKDARAINLPLTAGSGRQLFRKAVEEALQQIERFSPDIIFLSAGGSSDEMMR